MACVKFSTNLYGNFSKAYGYIFSRPDFNVFAASKSISHKVNYCTSKPENGKTASEFDENILEIIVCPFTKKPLRYDEEKQLLISDEIKVGFKIVKNIPNLVPQDCVKLE